MAQVIHDHINELQVQPLYDYEKERRLPKRDKRKFLPEQRNCLYYPC